MQATQVGVFVRGRGPGCLLIFALGLFAGCARHDGALSGADAAHQGAIELCRTYAPDLSEQDLRAMKIGSRDDFCTKYVGQPIAVTAQNGKTASSQSSTLTKDFFGKLCQAALPDESSPSAYCKKFADERRNEVERLSITTVSDFRTGFLSMLEMTKACLLLADRLRGGAPDLGYCLIDGRRGPFPAVESGDPNRSSDLQDLIKRRFPPGTRVAAMLDILAPAGFTCPPAAAEGQCTGRNGVLGFRKRRLRGIGEINWTIRWHADADGLLDRIDVAVTGASL